MPFTNVLALCGWRECVLSGVCDDRVCGFSVYDMSPIAVFYGDFGCLDIDRVTVAINECDLKRQIIADLPARVSAD